jgi:diguanylate cyclase (GGDEF)-like protein
MQTGRRSTDQDVGVEGRRRSDARRVPLRNASWESQRAQFLTRYFFWALGMAYFNLGGMTARSEGLLYAINITYTLYLVLISVYFWHAQTRPRSAWRWRAAMWTDLLAVGFTIYADNSVTPPTYFVYFAIIFGNGMRYGMGAFAEAVAGSFATGFIVVLLRFTDYLNALSPSTVFFLLLGSIVVLYAYSLMAQIERARSQLETETNLDTLTGLLNRRGLHERAGQLLRAGAVRGEPVALLFADLDGFKAVNDSQGHHVGDQVLQQTARVIRAYTREIDAVARFGGDEFVVLMPGTSLQAAELVAQRLQKAMADCARESSVSVSLSIGLGEAPTHGNDLETLLKRVVAAMYQGKQKARGGIQCASEAITV